MTAPSIAVAQSVPVRSGALDRVWWLALTGLCVVLLAPLLVVDVPPLLDYPNYLARVFVLASLSHDEVLGRFYTSNWSIIPNMALDLVAPPLIRVLPVHVVGRLLIAAAVVLPVLGTVAYNTAIGGRWWGFGVGLVAYNSCQLYGFLNFEIGLGVALLLAAAWLRWREDRPARAILLAVPGASVLFACHLMGLVVFGVLTGSAEMWRRCRERSADCIMRRGAVLALVFAAPCLLYAASALRQLGGDAQYLTIREKLLQLATTFVNYVLPLDMATAAAAIGVPAICLLVRKGRVPGPAVIAASLLLITF